MLILPHKIKRLNKKSLQQHKKKISDLYFVRFGKLSKDKNFLEGFYQKLRIDAKIAQEEERQRDLQIIARNQPRIRRQRKNFEKKFYNKVTGERLFPPTKFNKVTGEQLFPTPKINKLTEKEKQFLKNLNSKLDYFINKNAS